MRLGTNRSPSFDVIVLHLKIASRMMRDLAESIDVATIRSSNIYTNDGKTDWDDVKIFIEEEN